MAKNISKVAEPTTAKATTPVANNKKTADDIYKIIRGANSLDGYDAITAYVLYIFIKKVAENYGEYFENESVCTFTSIGVNYSNRYITGYDCNGIPLWSAFDEDNYNLPELDYACEKMVHESDDGCVYECVGDFINDSTPDDGDTEAREATIKFFEEYLENVWGFCEVKLTFDFGYAKIEVKR